MNSENGKPVVTGRRITADQQAWLDFGARLRESAIASYNETAKALMTAAALFLAFYGTTMTSSSVSPKWLLLIPVFIILFGVACCTVVLFPYRESVLAEDITAIQDYVDKVLKRKWLWSLGAATSMGIGVVVAFCMLLVS